MRKALTALLVPAVISRPETPEVSISLVRVLRRSGGAVTRAANLAPFLVVVLSACDSPQTRVSPTAPSTSAPQSSVTLSGTTLEHTTAGPRPVPNVPLLVRTGFSSFVFVLVTSDATGRYSLSDVPSGAVSIAPAPGSDYYAPCPAGSDVVRSNSTFDVNVVSASLLSTAGMPPSFPRSGSIWVSGIVFENTSQRSRPLAGATVNLDGDDADPRFGSTTLSDAEGRYLVCPPLPGTGSDTFATVRARKSGYRPGSRSAFLGWDYAAVDIELIRD
jgi:hypothetical protein